MKITRFIMILFGIIIINYSSYIVFAHDVDDYTLITWNNNDSANLQYRNWFLDNKEHIPETIGTYNNPLLFYISPIGYGMESTFNWAKLDYEIVSGLTINWSNMQRLIEDSILKWNNVYFRDNNEDKRVIYIQKTNDLVNANVIIYPSALKNSGDTYDYDYSYVNDNTYIEDKDIALGYTFPYSESCIDTGNHSHCTKFNIIFNLRMIFITTRTNRNEYFHLMDRIGTHEIGHILGLGDISRNGSAVHEELIMSNSLNNISNLVSDIAYQDLVGVAIYRGIHTDDDHKWLKENYTNGIRYRCKICNGYKYDNPGGVMDYYGHNESDIDNHVHSDEELMIVGMIKFPDNSEHYHYYRTCKYCSYVDCIAKNIIINIKTNTTHTCSCEDCGYEWTQNHMYEYDLTNKDAHESRCKICDYFKLFENHNFTYSQYDTLTHNLICADCGFETNEIHDMQYDSSIGKDICEDCGYII